MDPKEGKVGLKPKHVQKLQREGLRENVIQEENVNGGIIDGEQNGRKGVMGYIPKASNG